MKIRKTRYWVVIMPKGWAWIDTAFQLKEDAIREAVASSGNDWKTMRAQGFRVAKVTIQEVTK